MAREKDKTSTKRLYVPQERKQAKYATKFQAIATDAWINISITFRDLYGHCVGKEIGNEQITSFWCDL